MRRRLIFRLRDCFQLLCFLRFSIAPVHPRCVVRAVLSALNVVVLSRTPRTYLRTALEPWRGIVCCWLHTLQEQFALFIEGLCEEFGIKQDSCITKAHFIQVCPTDIYMHGLTLCEL